MLTLAEIIARLTRGYIKFTGKQPDNLAKIKIQQEALQKFKDSNKVKSLQDFKDKKGIKSLPVNEQFTTKPNVEPIIKSLDDDVATAQINKLKMDFDFSDRNKVLQLLDDIDSGKAFGAFDDVQKKELRDMISTMYTRKPDFASGGLARVGMAGGGALFKFIEGLFIKASNDIRLGKGLFKGLDQNQKIVQHDNLTKLVEQFQKTGKFDKKANEYFGIDAEKAFKDAEKQVLSKPTKTLEGIKEKGTIDISDPEVADEFSRFIKESDPKGYKDLEQKIKLSEADFDVTKGLDDLENIRGTKASEIMSIKLKYPGISDDLVRNIMVDDNPQRKAEVFATLDEAFKMMEKGKGEDEIIKIFKDTSRTKQASGGIAGQLHLNQGGRAGFANGLSAYQEGMQLMGPSNLRNFPGGDREEVWDPYKGSFTSYGYDTEGATAARNEIAGRLGEKGKEYLTQYDPDYDIDAMRRSFAPTEINASNVKKGKGSFEGNYPEYANKRNTPEYDRALKEYRAALGFTSEAPASTNAPGTTASTPVAGDKGIMSSTTADYYKPLLEKISALRSPITTFLTGGELAPRTASQDNRIKEMIEKQMRETGKLSGTIGYEDYSKSQAPGTVNPNMITFLKDLVMGDTTAEDFGNMGQMGTFNWDVNPETGKVDFNRGGSNIFDFKEATAQDYSDDNPVMSFLEKKAQEANKNQVAINPDVTISGFGKDNVLDPRMLGAQDKGMDARMGRTYEENIQAMADKRMLQAKGGLAKILGV